MIPMRLFIPLFLLALLLVACAGEAEPPLVEAPDATETPTPATPTVEPEPTGTTTPLPTVTVAAQAIAPQEATPTPAVAAPELAETCASPEVAELVASLQQALATENEDDLAALIHPQGLEVRMAWWNPPVHFSGGSLLSDDTSHGWGTDDGSGFAITGSFAEVALPSLQNDLVPATEIGCGEILHGATAGLVQLPPEDEGLDYVSLYRPAPPDLIEFDWGTWVVGYAESNGQPLITTLIHYAYEI
ncbi:MAG: hypothetical protein RRC07_06955 [Anaerolineae bacterium]|nr:hypothetical protein [Anaerolineae bacterium]